MSDEVKFIFKTLFKVPIFIIVSFFILNVFAFFFIYFKVLGLSYVVMQTAVENNYLPKTEAHTLANYAYTFEDIPMVTNSAIIVAKSGNNYTYVQPDTDMTAVGVITDATKLAIGNNSDVAHNAEGAGGIFGSAKTYTRVGIDSGANNTALKKVQYGKSVTVGVHCGYRMVWPLGYKETTVGAAATGPNQAVGGGVAGFKGATDTQFKDDTQLANDRNSKRTLIQFDICHTVPGLKYYPDLLSN